QQLVRLELRGTIAEPVKGVTETRLLSIGSFVVVTRLKHNVIAARPTSAHLRCSTSPRNAVTLDDEHVSSADTLLNKHRPIFHRKRDGDVRVNTGHRLTTQLLDR